MTAGFKKSAGVGILIIVGSIVVFTILIVVITDDVRAQAQKIEERKTALLRLANAASVLPALKNQEETVQKYESIMKNILPVQESLVEAPRWIAQAAGIAKVQASFSFIEEPVAATATSAGWIRFSLSAVGSWDGINAFIEAIEIKSSRFLVKLENTHLKMQNPTTYRMETQGKIYFSGTQEKQNREASSKQ